MNIIKFIFAITAVVLISSCNNNEEYSESSDSGKQNLVLNVTANQWEEKGLTRASYSSLSESSGNKTFSISFTSGDAIGLFICDTEGKVVVANQKYTYSGGSWTTETPIEWVRNLKNYTFFAYYPWASSLTGAPAVNSTPDITSADTFFASAVSSWTPAADQSTLAKFTAQDLMIGKGTTSVPLFHEVQVSFTMTHQMGMLVTKASLPYYDIDNPSDTWEVTQEFTTNIPCAINGNLYFFAKPGVETTLGTKTATVMARQIEQLFFTNGEPGKR